MKREYAAIMLILAPAFVGCATSARRYGPTLIPEKNTIFNPEWTGVSSSHVTRTEWPATVAFTPLGEEIEYAETIIDLQGRFGDNRDQTYYRRFSSVRKGRARR